MSSRIRALSSVLLVIAGAYHAWAQYSVTLPYKEVAVSNDGGAAVFQGAKLLHEPGQPQLPVYTVSFLLPSNVNLSDIKVTLNSPVEKDIEGTFDVQPGTQWLISGERLWPEGRPIVAGKDVEVYNSDSFYPPAYFGRITFGKMRQYQFIKIAVFPYKYNPVSRKLRMITGGTLAVELPAVPDGTSARATADPRDENILKDMTVNFQAIGATRSAAAARAGQTHAIFAPRAVFNQSQNLTTLMARIEAAGDTIAMLDETIISGASADQRADAMRTWLRANYLTKNIRYVLIVGNPNPTNGDFPMKLSHPLSSAGPIPTDYYFAELSGNWDINNNGIIGEYADFTTPGGPDQNPDVTVGRIPYYGNMSELEAMLNNNLLYQSRSNPESSYCNWRNTALLPITPVDLTTPGHQLGEQIKTDIFLPNGVVANRYYEDYYAENIIRGVVNVNPLPEVLNTSMDIVTQAWKKGFGQTKGVGMVVWRTPGSEVIAWDVMDRSHTAGVSSFPAILFQASGGNADPDLSDNLVYSLLKNGAAATTVAATRGVSSIVGETNYAGSSTDGGMAYEYTRQVVSVKLSCGNALDAVRSGMNIGYFGDWWNILVFNLFGTPQYAYYRQLDMPARPSNLTAQTMSQAQINLAWTGFATNGSGNEEGYTIARINDNGSYTDIGSVNQPTLTSYTVGGLQSGTKYRFAVKSYRNNAGGISDYCEAESTATLNGSNQSVIPAAPGTPAVTNAGLSARLTWVAVTGATYYVVKRSSSSSGPFVTIASNITKPFYTSNKLYAGDTYYFVVAAANNYGKSANSAWRSATPLAKSYITLPGRVQAEDYRPGGEGTGYHDNTTENTGSSSGSPYRSDDVDLEGTSDAGGGYNVGWIDGGEWLDFDVHVAAAGIYNLTARMASAVGGTKTMTVNLDGTTIGTFSTTDASGWQSWRNVVVSNVNLTAGNHVLRMHFTTGGFNVNYLDVTAQPSAAGTLQFSSSNYSVAENGGGVTLTVSRVNGSTGTVSVNYATANGSAQSGSDYTAANGTLTFQNGETSKTFSVSITDDASSESSETFTAGLSGATGGATIGSPSTATVTITDNDAPAGDLARGKTATSSSNESSSSTPNLAVDGNTATRWSSQYSDPQWIRIDLGASYTVSRVLLTWETASARDYRIEISGDGANWTTLVTKSNMANGARVDDLTGLSGTGRYIRMYGTARTTQWGYSLWSFEVYGNSSPVPGTLQFASSTYSVAENGGSVTLTVSRVNGSSGTVSVNYATANGSAQSGSDYTANSGTLTFQNGETSKTFSVSITDDASSESSETFTAGLSGATGGATIGSPSTATVTISDNDAPAGDLARGKTATSSSNEGSSTTPNLAVDGNTATRWSSQFSDPQWIRVDLGASYTVSRVLLNWETASAKDYRVEISGDGSTWTTLVTKTNMANGARVDNLTGLSGTGRYIRIYGTARTTQWGYSLWSFEVYGN